jgi:nuclear pore complex protein Nup85
LADLLLNHYNEEGSFSSTDLLDHLGPNMVLSDRLTFLAKYREFHRLCAGETGPAEAGEAHVAAANLLYSLLQSRLAPKYFWITLLIDTMPYLNNEGENAVIFSSEQTYEILHCLQVSLFLFYWLCCNSIQLTIPV